MKFLLAALIVQLRSLRTIDQLSALGTQIFPQFSKSFGLPRQKTKVCINPLPQLIKHHLFYFLPVEESLKNVFIRISSLIIHLYFILILFNGFDNFFQSDHDKDPPPTSVPEEVSQLGDGDVVDHELDENVLPEATNQTVSTVSPVRPSRQLLFVTNGFTPNQLARANTDPFDREFPSAVGLQIEPRIDLTNNTASCGLLTYLDSL